MWRRHSLSKKLFKQHPKLKQSAFDADADADADAIVLGKASDL